MGILEDLKGDDDKDSGAVKGPSVLDELDDPGDGEATDDGDGADEEMGQAALKAFEGKDAKALYEAIAKIAAAGS